VIGFYLVIGAAVPRRQRARGKLQTPAIICGRVAIVMPSLASSLAQRTATPTTHPWYIR
jgi:hypothetical protein